MYFLKSVIPQHQSLTSPATIPSPCNTWIEDSNGATSEFSEGGSLIPPTNNSIATRSSSSSLSKPSGQALVMEEENSRSVRSVPPISVLRSTRWYHTRCTYRWVAVILVTVIFIALVYLVSRQVKSFILLVLQNLMQLCDGRAYLMSVVLFFSIVIFTTICFPITPCIILSGFYFKLWGFILSWSATVLASAVVFFLCRHVCCDSFLDKFRRYSVIAPMAELIGESPFKFTLILRLSPIPVGIKNYGIVSLGVPFTPFLLASIVASIPYTGLSSALGATAHNLAEIMSDGYAKVPSSSVLGTGSANTADGLSRGDDPSNSDMKFIPVEAHDFSGSIQNGSIDWSFIVQIIVFALGITFSCLSTYCVGLVYFRRMIPSNGENSTSCSELRGV